MASEFIGYNVLVTLQVPPGGKLQGQVANVIGQTLLLKNGKAPVLHVLFTEL
jgi:enhancer of mRNA-decapping protein 3